MAFSSSEIVVLRQDEQALRESQRVKQVARTKQANVKKVLEDQLSQIEQERQAARDMKKKEAAELQDSIKQYEQEELQKWQHNKEQHAKTKQMYSQQVQHAQPCMTAALHPYVSQDLVAPELLVIGW